MSLVRDMHLLRHVQLGTDNLSHLIESLRNKRRFIDAGKVLLDYGRDVEGAVAALVEGTAYAEAIRLVRHSFLET